MKLVPQCFEYEWMLDGGPFREERLLTVHTDRGRDRVQRCCLLTSFQEGPHQKLFFQEKNQNSKVANWIIVDILNYLSNSFLLEM